MEFYKLESILIPILQKQVKINKFLAHMIIDYSHPKCPAFGFQRIFMDKPKDVSLFENVSRSGYKVDFEKYAEMCPYTCDNRIITDSLWCSRRCDSFYFQEIYYFGSKSSGSSNSRNLKRLTCYDMFSVQALKECDIILEKTNPLVYGKIIHMAFGICRGKVNCNYYHQENSSCCLHTSNKRKRKFRDI